MRENQDPDVLLVSDFKGMATTGGEYGASNEYLSILTNATVEKDGTIHKRTGSKWIYGLSSSDPNIAREIFQFSYYGRTWIVQRAGKALLVYAAIEDSDGIKTIRVLKSQSDILVNGNEPASFAVKAEGDYCHVFVATSSTQLISLTIIARDGFLKNVTSTSAKMDIGGFYAGASSSNSLVSLEKNDLLISDTSISINGSGEMTVGYSSNPGIVNGDRAFLFTCFWLRYCDSNYYTGTQIYNKGLRLNTIPLDANVETPESIRTNYIYNEPIQDLDTETLWIYKDSTVNAPRLPWAGNRNPSSVNQWDYSNGSYKNEAGQLTTRTPAFVAFGGLETNNISTQLNFARLRTLLIGAFQKPKAGDINVYADKKFRQTVFHNANGSGIADYINDEPTYFSMAATASASPGCSLDAVVEVIYIKAETGGAAVSNMVVDISRDLTEIVIGDGYVVPLYGYSILARQRAGVFPNKVYVIGNRLILSGNSNRVLISANDWNFRGMTLTNVQLSSFNFTENSPYLLQVEQGGGNINAIRSVNGVLIISTDSNTYRVTSTDRNSPPNATSAVVSRLTNQIATEDAIEVINNSVFMANSTGLYSLEYQSENDEGVVNDLSLEVSDVFRKYNVRAINYSRVLDSILISFSNNNKLLRYSLRSKTWSYVHVSIPNTLRLFSTFDGYTFLNDRIDNNGNVFNACTWDASLSKDMESIDFLTTISVDANSKAFANEPSEVEAFLATQPALVGNSNSNLELIYNNRIQNTSGSPITFVESVAGNVARDIVAGFSTKAHHNGKLNSALRYRNINLILSGYGSCSITVVPTSSTKENVPIYREVSIATDGKVTVDNKETAPAQKGTEAIVLLSDLGISESFSLAVEFEGLVFVGYQFDTGAKSNRKLK